MLLQVAKECMAEGTACPNTIAAYQSQLYVQMVEDMRWARSIVVVSTGPSS